MYIAQKFKIDQLSFIRFFSTVKVSSPWKIPFSACFPPVFPATFCLAAGTGRRLEANRKEKIKRRAKSKVLIYNRTSLELPSIQRSCISRLFPARPLTWNRICHGWWMEMENFLCIILFISNIPSLFVRLSGVQVLNAGISFKMTEQNGLS